MPTGKVQKSLPAKRCQQKKILFNVWRPSEYIFPCLALIRSKRSLFCVKAPFYGPIFWKKKAIFIFVLFCKNASKELRFPSRIDISQNKSLGTLIEAYGHSCTEIQYAFCCFYNTVSNCVNENVEFCSQ